jgi:hypothetical protein
MNKKILIVIALIGIGLWALPSTMSLFAGQHSFVNIDATGNQIDCVKCHGDVKAELQSGHSDVTGTNAPHANFKCEYCHRIEAGASSGDNAYGQIKYSGSNVSRVIVVSLLDMEAGNIPAVILVNDDTTTVKTQPTVSGVAMGKFAMTKCMAPKPGVFDACSVSGTVLTAPAKNSWKLVSTYNAATGTPKDTQANTSAYGFDVSKMNFTYTAPVGGSKPAGEAATDVLIGAGSRTVNPGTSYHAASLVSCMECHAKDEPMGHYTRVADGTVNGGVAQCSNCHYGGSDLVGSNRYTSLWAGGFGITGGQDTGVTEAHMEFVNTNDNMTRYKDDASNGACIACHTHVATDITYNKPTNYSFNVDMTSGATEVLSGFAAN